MFEVGVYEAKTNLPKILRRVEGRGESCLITRRGKPVGRLVPVAQDKDDIAARWDDFLGFARERPLTASLKEILEWKNEGRK